MNGVRPNQFPPNLNQLERFWFKVEFTADCWIWHGGRSKKGYGLFTTYSNNKRTITASRFAYELVIGPIPETLTIDHLCQNTSCVNPFHLEPVTNQENTLRGASPSAVQSRQTYCLRGHPFYGSNLKIRSGGRGRDCRLCTNLRNKEKYKNPVFRNLERKRHKEICWRNKGIANSD